MLNPDQVKKQRNEINEIFGRHANFVVRIFGADDPSTDSGREPDLDILLNLDKGVKENEGNEDLVVCLLKSSQTIKQIHPDHRHGMVMEQLMLLTSLLNCSVNIVDERGLQSFYPITYSKLRNG